MRTYKIGLVGLLIMVLVSACGPQTNAAQSVTATPQTIATQSATATPQIVVEQQIEATAVPTEPVPNCLLETCVQNAIIASDGENLLVLFDLTDRNGEVVFGDEKFITGNLLVAGYLLSENGSEETIFKAELGYDQYYCYSGEDMPWNQGELTAVCGFSAPIAELSVDPQIGDRVRIELPLFDGYAQEITVQDRKILE